MQMPGYPTGPAAESTQATIRRRNARTCGIIAVLAVVALCGTYALMFAVLGQFVKSPLAAQMGRANAPRVAAIFPTDTPLPPFQTPAGGVGPGAGPALAAFQQHLAAAQADLSTLQTEMDAADFYTAAWQTRVNKTTQDLDTQIAALRAASPPEDWGLTPQRRRVESYLARLVGELTIADTHQFAPALQVVPLYLERSQAAVTELLQQIQRLQATPGP
jgi:hypothetical protein